MSVRGRGTKAGAEAGLGGVGAGQRGRVGATADDGGRDGDGGGDGEGDGGGDDRGT